MKKFLLHNFYLKTVSFTIALIFWIVVIQGQKSERILNIKLNIDKPSHLIITNDFEDSLSVKVSGQVGRIKRIIESKTHAKVTIRDGQIGYLSYQITPDKIDLPYDVDIVSIKPSLLFLNVDEIKLKRVPVKLQFSGQAPLGYSLSDYSVTPNFAEVKGPASEINKLNELFLPSINISERFRDFEDSIKLSNPSANISIVDNTIAYKISVKFRVNYLKKKFYNIPISITNDNVASDIEIFPETIAFVVIEGPEEVIRDLNKNSIGIRKNISSIEGGENGKIEIFRDDFVLQKSMRIIDFKPKEVMVKKKE